MARPRKHEEARRTAQIGVRFTRDELDRLAREAGRARLSLTAYVRRLLLSGRVTVQQTRALDWPAFDQLRRIGVNLNQAMRIANAKGEIHPELIAAAAAVEQFLSREIEGDGSEGRR